MHVELIVALLAGAVMGYIVCDIIRIERSPKTPCYVYDEFWLSCEVGSVLVRRSHPTTNIVDEDGGCYSPAQLNEHFIVNAALVYPIQDNKVVINGAPFRMEVKRVRVFNLLQEFDVPAKDWIHDVLSVTKRYKTINHLDGATV